jgi:hypothetical protein
VPAEKSVDDDADVEKVERGGGLFEKENVVSAAAHHQTVRLTAARRDTVQSSHSTTNIIKKEGAIMVM